MKCKTCKGACCETFSLSRDEIAITSRDALRWLKLHSLEIPGFFFEARCRMLTPTGRCKIYEDRPLTCAIYPVGGQDCLDAVKLRRSPQEYQKIRDKDDPETL